MIYKFLDHTADVKFQAFGKTMEECFKHAAYAMKEVIAGKLDVKPKMIKTIEISAKDKEALLYKFIEEFLFLLDAESFLLSKIDSIKIEDNKLKMEVSGDEAHKYEFSNDVKAVTYNSMFIKKVKEKYVCQIVLDV